MRVKYGFVLGLACFMAVGCRDDGVSTVGRVIEIPALVPLSGDYGATGTVSLAALQVAVEDLNQELADQGITVDLDYGDTESNPEASAVLMNSYLLNGRRIIVGPYTSADVAGVHDMIGGSSSLLISPASTSLSLAEADNHIYRLAPNDSHMVERMVDLMWARGQRYLVLIYRDDAWGNSVAAEMQAQWVARGGSIISTHAYFSLRVTIIRDILEEVAADIAAQTGVSTPDEIGIQLTCFNEGGLVFQEADSIPGLGDYRWYGSDGFVQDQYIVDDSTLAAFAVRTDYTAPIFRAEAADAFTGVVQRIESKAGVTAGTYALLTYDAMQIAGRTLARMDSTASYEQLKTALGEVLDSYQGISGPVVLDAAGDRAGGSYDLYTVQKVGGTYQWVLVNGG